MYRSLAHPLPDTPCVDALEARLTQHFALLGARRRSSRLPVFALEHGLDAAERDELELGLREQLCRSGYRPSRHWLAWTIFACELAYADDGTDYWRRFESQVPGWNPNWRNHLRDWFEDFASQFCGYRPMGRWAETYSIISWPLCHAMLPRDLQWQLGRTLYELRDTLPSLTRLRPVAAGQMIARRNRGGSSRFENWIEQPELVGLVVQSLTTELENVPLNRDAISRICDDMRSDRMAAPWFEEVWRRLRPATDACRQNAVR